MTWSEDGLNLIEWVLGLDLDGDGDVGLAGTPAQSRSAFGMIFGRSILTDADAVLVATLALWFGVQKGARVPI